MADPDRGGEGGRGGGGAGFDLLARLAFLSFPLFSLSFLLFLPKTRGDPPPRAPSLDLPLLINSSFAGVLSSTPVLTEIVSLHRHQFKLVL